MIIKFLKRLFCNHHYYAIGGIYGDNIIDHGWKRSIWKCSKCGKVQYRDSLEGVQV